MAFAKLILVGLESNYPHRKSSGKCLPEESGIARALPQPPPFHPAARFGGAAPAKGGPQGRFCGPCLPMAKALWAG